MAQQHVDKYKFAKPKSIREAKVRMRTLRQSIRDIDMQLGDRREKQPGYAEWRTKAQASKNYKAAEYDFLKDELLEMRRVAEARNANIWDPNDPRHLLMRLRDEVDKFLHDEDSDLEVMLGIVDRYFEHNGDLKEAKQK